MDERSLCIHFSRVARVKALRIQVSVLSSEVHTRNRPINGFGLIPSQISMCLSIEREVPMWHPLMPMRAVVRSCSS